MGFQNRVALELKWPYYSVELVDEDVGVGAEVGFEVVE